MKLKNIFMSLLAAAFVATGCEEEKLPELAELQVSQSIIGFDAKNPKPVQVTFTATTDWQIVSASGDKNLPEWFTIDKTNGVAGETIVTFTAKGDDEVSHEADLNVNCIDAEKHLLNVQHLLVKQGVQSKEITPLNFIATKGVEGATYYVHAIIKEVTKEKYGNLVLEDESGTLNVYGTLNDDGEEGHFTDLGLGVGDEIWAHGPFKPYNGTPQLKNITVDKFKKSLVLLEEDMNKFELEKGDQDIEVLLKVAGDGVEIKPVVVVPDGEKTKEIACSWISVAGVNVTSGKGSVKLHIAANDDVKPRDAKVYFTSKKGDDASTVFTIINQKGNVPEKITVKEAMTSDYVNVDGTVMATFTDGYVMADATATILVYYDEKQYDNSKKIGDKVNVVGKTSNYNFTRQITDPDLDEAIGKDEVKYAEPLVLDMPMMKELAAKIEGLDKNKDLALDIQYAKMTGVYKWGDRYKNLIVEDGAKLQGSIYKIDDKLYNTKDFDGKRVDIYGYFVQISGGKFFNMVVTDIKEAGEVVVKPLLDETFWKNQGAFTIESVTKIEDKDAWFYSQFKDRDTQEIKDCFMKASGYVSKKCQASECYLISPVLNLAGRKAAKLTFEQAGANFGSRGDAVEVTKANLLAAVSVVVREKGATEWTKLEASAWPNGNGYTFVKSEVDLSAYADKEIQFAFKYTSTTKIAGTWEVKNVVVK